jgi:hypothetical protein
MRKKVLTIGIICLFLLTGLNLYPSEIKAVTVSSFGKTIYVDDVFGEGPDNPPEDYTSIQEAIDNSIWSGVHPWDKILVHTGIYEENIDVNKDYAKIVSVNGPTNTIINGNEMDGVVKFSERWVHFEGFTVSNSIGDGVVCNGIQTTIKNNIIYNNSKNGIIINNKWLEIRNNIISNNNVGLSLFGNGYQCSVIYNNTLVNNDVNAYDETNYFISKNIWCGNYWGDYEDKYNVKDENEDNILDYPYQVGEYNYDFYPLVNAKILPNNFPPHPPFIVEISRGSLQEFKFSINVFDLNGDDFYLFVEWGDGTTTENWLGPYSSGFYADEVELSHKCSREDKIVFYVKDEHGALGYGSIIKMNSKAKYTTSFVSQIKENTNEKSYNDRNQRMIINNSIINKLLTKILSLFTMIRKV